jgi:hypothetical protein
MGRECLTLTAIKMRPSHARFLDNPWTNNLASPPYKVQRAPEAAVGPVAERIAWFLLAKTRIGTCEQDMDAALSVGGFAM